MTVSLVSGASPCERLVLAVSFVSCGGCQAGLQPTTLDPCSDWPTELCLEPDLSMWLLVPAWPTSQLA